jgi:MGT family glycosyltransferase
LVTLGGSDDAWPQATKNVVVGGYVPHATVLPQAELVVCHAGLWTVMTALRYGVPLLCAPLGRDQPNNASRVEAVGAGRVLRPDADVPTIREALVQVLADESYRKAASRMEAAIASSGGAAAAADELESLVAG